jgi:hypothetical protein
MAKSYYLEDNLLNYVLNNTLYTAPTAVYLALYTVSPGPSGGGTEVSTSGTGYARQAVTCGTASSGSITTNADIVFPTATGSGWGTIAYAGIFDDPTTGNLLYYGALTTSKVINVGDQLKIASGTLTLTES